MPSNEQLASPGALGGSANERASELRARVGAQLASAALRSEALRDIGLELDASPVRLVGAEGDEPVDDLIAEVGDGSRVFVQVKLKAGLDTTPGTPFDEALGQFVRAVRAGLGPGDAVVLAAAEITQPLRALGVLLDRERLSRAHNPSPAEKRAYVKLQGASARYDLSDDELRTLCGHLHIWPTDPTHGDGAALLQARLDGHVAEPGHGAEAARALADVVRSLARERGGLDGPGLARALLARDVPLARDARPGSAVASARALAEYRARISALGNTLRLIGIRAPLGELPFDAADAKVEVEAAAEERPTGRPLELAARRRGRVILEGRPGGGKSTALRMLAAHAAARDDWPVPVRLHLRRLVAAGGSFTDAVLDTAVGELAGDARATLRAALAVELTAGNVLVLLDGLDEVRAGRTALIEDLGEWIGALPDGVEVVIAARPAAARDAELLALPVLRLKPPDRPTDLSEAILRAVAPADRDAAETDKRVEWVAAAFERDPQLRATPLSVVVVSVIAARAPDLIALPAQRADLLKRALDDIVREWELEYRAEGRATVGRLEGRAAAEALTICLRVLGTAALADEPPGAKSMVAAVAARLCSEFTLGGPDAQAAALDAIEFWEYAGLVAFDAGALDFTLRPFGELAAAWDAVECADPRDWVAEMRASPDLWPALALASGLAPPFGEAWAAAVRDDAGADELEAFAVGLRDGARLSQTAIDQAARDCGARLLADPDEAAEAAPILISLPLSSETRDALRPLLTTALGRNRALAVDALVAAHWDEPGPDADERLRAFIVGARPEPPSPPPPEPNVLLMPERDELYGGAFEAAAVRLAAGLRADAELVAGAFEDGGIEFRWELQQALRRGGHDDLAADVNLGMSGFGRFAADWNLEDFEACERALLGWAAALAPPVVLCARQRRRLDDLADLWATAALNWVHPSWPLKRPELAEMWLGAVAVIGGFDLGVVAAQAQIVLDDMDMGEQTEKLVYDHAEGPVVPLDRWDLAQDPATLLRDLVEMLGLCAHQVAWRAARAIGTAPQDLGAAGLLEYRLKHLRKWSRWFAARLMLIVEEDPAGAGPGGDVRAIRWASSEDMWLRAAAAEWLAYRYLATGGEAGSAALDLLADPDETVRDAALDGFGLMPEHLDERARRALRATRESDRQPWTCIYCGESNPAAAQPGCSSCHTSGPSVRSHVGEILGERPGAADQIRFASRRRSRRRRA